MFQSQSAVAPYRMCQTMLRVETSVPITFLSLFLCCHGSLFHICFNIPNCANYLRNIQVTIGFGNYNWNMTCKICLDIFECYTLLSIDDFCSTIRVIHRGGGQSFSRSNEHCYSRIKDLKNPKEPKNSGEFPNFHSVCEFFLSKEPLSNLKFPSTFHSKSALFFFFFFTTHNF